MQDIKENISKNIAALRAKCGLTQLELAEKLNYSDKAVSKWERGESLPDISAFFEMSKIFGVSIDDIVNAEEMEKVYKKTKKEKQFNFKIIKYIVDGFIWSVALLMFVVTFIVRGEIGFSWIYFVYTLPVEFIVTLVLNSIWFNRRNNYIIISELMWSVLAAIFSTFVCFGSNYHTALIFILGIAGEIIIVLWSFIKHKPKSGSKEVEDETN